MSDVDKLSARRRWLLVIMGLSFLIWQVSDLEIAGQAGGALQDGISAAGLVGALVWIGALVALLLTFKRGQLAKPVRDALEDELVRANRRTAFAIGYGVMIVAAAGLFVLSIFVDIIAKDALNGVLVAGIVGPMFAFAWLEGRGG